MQKREITSDLYSDEGHRQATINSSGTSNFVWDNDIVLLETTASGVVQAQYTQGAGTWDLLLSQNRSGPVQYLGPDDRENIRLVLSGAAAVAVVLAGCYYSELTGNQDCCEQYATSVECCMRDISKGGY